MPIMKRSKPPKFDVYALSSVDKEIINLVSADAAELEGITKSAAILAPFREKYLPRTSSGNTIVKLMVAGGDGVKTGLAQLCASLAGGINWRPRYSNGQDVLEYLDVVLLEHNIFIDFGSASILQMLGDFDSVVSVIKEAAEGLRGSFDQETLANLRIEAEYGGRLLKQFEFSAEKGRDAWEPAANLTRYIRGNWCVLSNQQVVWRCLWALCDASKGWPDCCEQGGESMHVVNGEASRLRMGTISLIDRITAEWEEEDAARNGA